MKINIGSYKHQKVFFDTENSMNSHILSLGKSGSGKTVENQRIIASIVENGGTVIAFDLHQTLASDQIFWKYSPTFNKYVNDIDVYYQGISCDLFTPISYPDGTQERVVDTVGAITDMFTRVMRLGCKQLATLRCAIREVLNSGAYESMGISAISHELLKIGTQTAEQIREKLYMLSGHNVFQPGELFIKDSRINVIRLSRFDLATQELIAEILLTYLWRLATTGKFKSNEIYVFIDEVQNMPSGKNSAIARILSEGRKFKLNLLLATQQLKFSGASLMEQRLTQCGLVLLFQPDVANSNRIAKLINSTDVNQWVTVLRTLRCGEFISVGSIMVGDRWIEQSLKISAREDAK